MNVQCQIVQILFFIFIQHSMLAVLSKAINLLFTMYTINYVYGKMSATILVYVYLFNYIRCMFLDP